MLGKAVREGASRTGAGRLGLNPTAFSSRSTSADNWLPGGAAAAAAGPPPAAAELSAAVPWAPVEPAVNEKERLRPERGGSQDTPLLREPSRREEGSNPLLLLLDPSPPRRTLPAARGAAGAAAAAGAEAAGSGGEMSPAVIGCAASAAKAEGMAGVLGAGEGPPE
jgi:hypothetical protein